MSTVLQPDHEPEPSDPYAPYTLEDLLLHLDNDALDDALVSRLSHTSPAVVGLFLERLSVEERRKVLRRLTTSKAAEVLAEMDAEESAQVVGAMREWRALKILEDLDPDDAADVLGKLDASSRDRLLSKMSPAMAKTVLRLLSYDPNTAGGVMNPQIATVYQFMTANEAIEHIRKHKDDIHQVTYIYVVNEHRHLLGVLSMRDLLLAGANQLIDAIMQTDVQGVCSVDQDKESVALKMAECNLYALPVVSQEGHLLGIVEHDDVIDILQTAATEDIQKMVGAGPDEGIHDPISYSIRRRSPWLLVNLCTALLSVAVVNCFRGSIEAMSILAVYMPLVASLGGNTGSQTLAIAIRSLALGEVKTPDHVGICIRELLKGFFSGIVVGLTAGAICLLATQKLKVAGVVAVATIMTMCLGGLAGAFIPLLLKQFKLDPAQSSSIFLTASTDIVGYLIFLSLGSWLLL